MLFFGLMSLCLVAHAVGPQWTWEAGKQTTNGAITVKSTSGGTYSATQNPTGAVTKTNQNAVTQPPTVIIQSTSGGGGSCLQITRTRYNGGMGGRAGANANCVAEFGTGWKLATIWEAASCLGGYAIQNADQAWVDTVTNNNCSTWSDGTGGATGPVTTTNDNNGVGHVTTVNQGCNNSAPLMCFKPIQ